MRRTIASAAPAGGGVPGVRKLSLSSPVKHSSARSRLASREFWADNGKHIAGALVVLWVLTAGYFYYSHPTTTTAKLVSTPVVNDRLVEFLKSNQHHRIPKLIHQSWKTTEVLMYSFADNLHHTFGEWIQSWPKKNPDWQYVFWTDEDNYRLFADVPALRKYRSVFAQLKGVNQADFSRYGYMYVFGGVYVDLDFECVVPLDYLATSYDAFVAPEPKDQTIGLYGLESVVCNAIMGSRPGHPFWIALMDKISGAVSNCTEKLAVQCTGPLMMQEVFDDYQKRNFVCNDEVLVKLPYEYFYPEVAKYNQEFIRGQCREKKLHCEDFKDTEPMFAFHHWAGVHHRNHSNFKYEDISTVIPARQFNRGQDLVNTILGKDT